MITFKEYLREEDEDQVHRVVKQAAEAYVKHCTQWKDVSVPLYRLSTPQEGAGSHRMRTRVPRMRQSESLGGTRELQKMIFSQPGWEKFPDRLHSIFCSTNKEFVVGSIDDYSENLLIIFPFDGVKMGITKDELDFNYINVMKGTGYQNNVSLMDFTRWISNIYYKLIGKWSSDIDWKTALNFIKSNFVKNGRFDPDANGDKELAEKLREWRGEGKIAIEAFTKMPEIWTPERLGCELVTPATIDLPGKTREVWFSGKYLSIPSADYKAFIKEVKALQDGVELPPKSTQKTKAPSTK